MINEEDTKKKSNPIEPIEFDHKLDKSEKVESTMKFLDETDIID